MDEVNNVSDQYREVSRISGEIAALVDAAYVRGRDVGEAFGNSNERDEAHARGYKEGRRNGYLEALSAIRAKVATRYLSTKDSSKAEKFGEDTINEIDDLYFKKRDESQ